jgi:hypothetical protein
MGTDWPVKSGYRNVTVAVSCLVSCRRSRGPGKLLRNPIALATGPPPENVVRLQAERRIEAIYEDKLDGRSTRRSTAAKQTRNGCEFHDYGPASASESWLNRG